MTHFSFFNYQHKIFRNCLYITKTTCLLVQQLQSLKSKVNFDRLGELFNELVILSRTDLLYITCNTDTL